MKQMIGLLILSCLVPVATVSAGQEPEAASAKTQTPLKMQIVVSRFQGEKKISTTPYTLAVVAGSNSETTRLRMGVDVPVPQTVIGEGNTAKASYNYRSVGTNIDCTARPVGGGVFRIIVAVSDTSVFMPDTDKRGGDSAAPTSRVPGVPAFRTFTSNFNLLLKDGQVAQHTAATDPVSGEVLRIDVTLSVLK